VSLEQYKKSNRKELWEVVVIQAEIMDKLEKANGKLKEPIDFGDRITFTKKALEAHNLEQQAKGVDDAIEWLVTNYPNECNPCAGLLGYFKSGLSTKAKALKEQGE
jgi:hypothetical protein